jgi:cell division cycle protein 20 (cofactor of APC complex)
MTMVDRTSPPGHAWPRRCSPEEHADEGDSWWRPGTPRTADRHIPRRSVTVSSSSNFELLSQIDEEQSSWHGGAWQGVHARLVARAPRNPAVVAYRDTLSHTLGLGGCSLGAAGTRVLSFTPMYPPPQPACGPSAQEISESEVRWNRIAHRQPRKHSRTLPQAPERILDAPELLDDYYLTLLDWSSTNVLGVALNDSIYLWNASDGGIQQLLRLEGAGSPHVTSLAWSADGCMMGVGTSDHKVQIWDVERLTCVRTMHGHRARVASLSWNGRLLSSGGRDSAIIHHDVQAERHRVTTLRGHTQEVCGLKWSPSGKQLASGGNDNLLNIWDDRYASRIHGVCDASLHRLDAHQAAVKALAWCPWQRNLLASGGGTADRMIRFWNTNSGACLSEVDTQSQVCALQWSQHDKELVSSHGYSHNQLILWKYPSMVKVAELTGHTSRVLHMAQSPDGTTVVTAAADETLRFWKILSGGDASKKERAAAKDSILNSMSIR